MAAKDRSGWTPYGLEAIRIRHIRRRRLLALLAALALAGFWSWMFEETTTTQQEIFANGKRAGSGIQIDVQEPEEEDGPVTVALSPGRVTRADTSQQGGQQTIDRPAAPVLSRAPAYNWTSYLILYGPFALIGLALWLLAAKRRPEDEVNFGIYKGAMPLEMITSSARHHVLTRREARESVFGRRRRDHLPAELRVIERVEQEGDA